MGKNLLIRGIDPTSSVPLSSGYGESALIRPRLGQRSFRIVVLYSYGRRCAVTNEKTLPALEAAPIRDYRDGKMTVSHFS